MPATFDASLRANAICDAAVVLLDQGGTEAVTLRALARGARMSTGSILHHLECRDRVLGVTSRLVRERLTEACRPPFAATPGQVVEALFPTDPGDVQLVRAYLLLRVRAHVEPEVVGAFGHEDREEAGRLVVTSGLPVARVTLVAATVLGLREQVYGPRTLAREEALDELLQLVDLLRPSA